MKIQKLGLALACGMIGGMLVVAPACCKKKEAIKGKAMAQDVEAQARALAKTIQQRNIDAEAAERELLQKEYREKMTLKNSVFFKYDNADLSAEARKDLTERVALQAAKGLRVKNMKISILGFCDQRGTTAYNLALGQKRAQAVANYLIALGFESKNIKVVSYGKEKPLCDADALDAKDEATVEACHAKNRRATFFKEKEAEIFK